MPKTRESLVNHLKQRGILQTDRIIEAFESVPREDFIPQEHRENAYADNPLPIGGGQTISAPHMVAHMTELLDPQPTEKVLEIGAGSGYQAVILSHLVDEVITVEIVEALAEQAQQRLEKYDNVTVIHADGSDGYAPEAPYDKIIYTAAAPDVPEAVFDQLEEGGIVVAPVGKARQELKTFRKTDGEIVEETHAAVRFVPLTGEKGSED